MALKVVSVALILVLSGRAVVADNTSKPYPLDDYLLLSAKSEKEMKAWALGKSSFAPPLRRRDSAETRRFQVNGHDLVVLLSTPPMATNRILIDVYVGNDKVGWNLILHRYTNSAAVKIEQDNKTNSLVFRSKAGKLLVTLPAENLDLQPSKDEQ